MLSVDGRMDQVEKRVSMVHNTEGKASSADGYRYVQATIVPFRIALVEA